MKFKDFPSKEFFHLISAPFIYVMIVPLFILDIFLEVYQNICFRLYNIKLIRRKDYILIDRQRLSYLSFLEKINCTYCGYANGLLNYAVKIAAETEGYWCGIKHDAKNGFREPMHHKQFLEYNDKKSYAKLNKK